MYKVLRKFLSKSNKDTFIIDGVKKLRGTLKTSKEGLQILKDNKKTMEDFDKIDFPNPFETEYCKSYSKTDAQLFIERNASKMEIIGNMAIKCSCGAGKTLAGLIMFSQLGYKTLIISNRCAINEQWKKELLNIYGDSITVKTREGIFKGNKEYKITKDIPIDVYIYSPQYINEDIKRFPNDVGFIIYDEVHSLLSEEFSKVLTIPFLNVINGDFSELPYMLCMSATYPSKNSKEYKEIINIFGIVYEQPSTITDIPIYIYDIRDHLTSKKDDVFDKNYTPLSDIEVIDKIIKNKIKFYNETIEPTILNFPQYCGFIITSTIDSSIYAWLKFYIKYKNVNKRCILIRENTKGCYILKNDIPKDLLELGPIVGEKDILKHKSFNDFCEKINSYKHGDILFGTYHRLKEGISVQNAVWGVCTKFVWSCCSRVQILGRIRRNSNNEELNGFKRYFMVNSCKIPTNIGKLIAMRKGHKKTNKEFKLEIEYDTKEENEIFKKENYIRV